MLATLGFVLAMSLSSGMTIDCSRKADTCVVREVIGPGFAFTTKSFPLHSIAKVEVRAAESRSYDFAVVHDDSVDAFQSTGLADMATTHGVALAMNAYLIMRGRDEFHEDSAHSAPFWLWLVATLGLVGVVLVSRTTIVIDHGAGVIRMRTSVRGRDLEVPIADIERAVLHGKTDDDGATVTAAALVRRDGSLVFLRPHSRDEPELKRKVLAEVTAALDLPS